MTKTVKAKVDLYNRIYRKAGSVFTIPDDEFEPKTMSEISATPDQQEAIDDEAEAAAAKAEIEALRAEQDELAQAEKLREAAAAKAAAAEAAAMSDAPKPAEGAEDWEQPGAAPQDGPVSRRRRG